MAERVKKDGNGNEEEKLRLVNQRPIMCGEILVSHFAPIVGDHPHYANAQCDVYQADNSESTHSLVSISSDTTIAGA